MAPLGDPHQFPTLIAFDGACAGAGGLHHLGTGGDAVAASSLFDEPRDGFCGGAAHGSARQTRAVVLFHTSVPWATPHIHTTDRW